MTVSGGRAHEKGKCADPGPPPCDKWAVPGHQFCSEHLPRAGAAQKGAGEGASAGVRAPDAPSAGRPPAAVHGNKKKKKCAATLEDGSPCPRWPVPPTLYCRDHRHLAEAPDGARDDSSASAGAAAASSSASSSSSASRGLERIA